MKTMWKVMKTNKIKKQILEFLHFWPMTIVVPILLLLILFPSIAGAETKIKYKSWNKMPCSYNGVKITSSATINNYEKAKKGPCPNTGVGYAGKQGTTLEVKRGTPIFAVKDMKLILATDYSSEYNCSPDNSTQHKYVKGRKWKKLTDPRTGKKMKCAVGWDGLKMYFDTVDGDRVLFYHMMPDTPLVPGFGKGKCKIRKFYKIHNANVDQRQAITVTADQCGGIKKEFVKKGELIGYVGHATSDHISFNIAPAHIGHFLNAPESKKHGMIWENYPKNPNAFLLPIMSKKYLKEIKYEKYTN